MAVIVQGVISVSAFAGFLYASGINDRISKVTIPCFKDLLVLGLSSGAADSILGILENQCLDENECNRFVDRIVKGVSRYAILYVANRFFDTHISVGYVTAYNAIACLGLNQQGIKQDLIPQWIVLIIVLQVLAKTSFVQIPSFSGVTDFSFLSILCSCAIYSDDNKEFTEELTAHQIMQIGRVFFAVFMPVCVALSLRFSRKIIIPFSTIMVSTVFSMGSVAMKRYGSCEIVRD